MPPSTCPKLCRVKGHQAPYSQPETLGPSSHRHITKGRERAVPFCLWNASWLLGTRVLGQKPVSSPNNWTGGKESGGIVGPGAASQWARLLQVLQGAGETWAAWWQWTTGWGTLGWQVNGHSKARLSWLHAHRSFVSLHCPPLWKVLGYTVHCMISAPRDSAWRAGEVWHTLNKKLGDLY